MRTNPSSHEEWRPIAGYEEIYEVSNHGRVRWSPALRGRKAGKIVNRVIHKSGYARVALMIRPRNRRWLRVHQLVCEAWHGPPPSTKHEVAHADGDKLNNVPTNVRWATRLENAADMIAHGTQYRGTRHRSSKLTEEQVRFIRANYKPVIYTMKQLARDFGVSNVAIRKIVRSESWRWLS